MNHGIDFAIFRENLRKGRIVHEYTAKSLSETLQLRTKKRISDIEEGLGKPTLEEIYMISQVFGVTIDNLLFKELKVIIQ